MREFERLCPSSRAEFFLCGPEPMLAAARSALRRCQVDDPRIHEERFVAPTSSHASTTPQAMTVTRGGRVIGSTLVAVDRTVLDAGLAAGIPLSYSCGSGTCGECRVMLCRGKVAMAEPNCLSNADRTQGWVLACVSRPLTPIEIAIDQSTIKST